jgi:HK97 family phage portal protein
MNIINKIKSLFGNERGWNSFFMFSKFDRKYGDYDMLRGLVFACLNAIASKVGTINLILRKRKDDKIVDEHPILDMIRNPYPYITYFQFLYLTAFYLGLKGKALWWIKEGETKSRKFLVPISHLNPVLKVENNKIFYEFIMNNETKKLPDEEVLDFKRPHPFNPFEGLSVLEQARLEVEADLQAVDIFKGFLKRGAVPSGILKTKGEMTEETYQRIKSQVNEEFTGDNNFFKPMVLENLEWQNITIPFKDLEFIEQRKFTRDQILAIFGVPKAMLFADDVNRANSEAAKYWFAEYTVKPYMDIIIDTLENDLLKKLGAFDVYFDYENFIPEDKEYELRKIEVLTDRVMTRNEVRNEMGLDRVEGGDTLYLPNGLPVGEVINQNKEVKEKKVFKTKRELLHIEERDKYLDKKERYYKGRLKIVFNLFLDRIKKHKKKSEKAYTNVSEVIFEFNPYFEYLEDDLAVEIGKAKVTVAEMAVEMFEKVYGISLNFNLEDTGAIKYLTNKAMESADNITNNVIKRIREILADMLSEGKFSLEKAKNRIMEELTDEIDWRVERIVRTELIDAYSYSDSQIIKNNNLIQKKKWITAKDDRVCPDCARLNGEIVDKNALFSGGVDSAPFHPNCRCAVVPVF